MMKNFFQFNPKRAAYYQKQELPFHVEFKVAEEMDRAWISKFCDRYFSAYNLPDIAALRARGHEAWVVDLDVWCDEPAYSLVHPPVLQNLHRRMSECRAIRLAMSAIVQAYSAANPRAQLAAG